MTILGPTPIKRLNEAGGLVLLAGAICLTLSLVSYRPFDPSWNTAAGPVEPSNYIGAVGAHVADLCLQALGLAAFTLPVMVLLLAWRWLGSQPIEAQAAKIIGCFAFVLATSAGLSLLPDIPTPLGNGAVSGGGVLGMVLAGYLVSVLNHAGAAVAVATSWILSLYLISSFSVLRLKDRILPSLRFSIPWPTIRRRRKAEQVVEPEPDVEPEEEPAFQRRAQELARRMSGSLPAHTPPPPPAPELPPYQPEEVEEPQPVETDIPIRTLEDAPFAPAPRPEPVRAAYDRRAAPPPPVEPEQPEYYELPSTELLNEPPSRGIYDRDELKEIAGAIKSKFEEFNVLGSVVQINPGPVVTTFEFKPEAGIKYSRITTLNDDLCLGLQAESILIERIPGKPTVGIEVPNSRREVISLRQVIESEEFQNMSSRLPVTLGKDISGRIKAVPLEAMPHLLIAGSTGSGKSVMLNSLIMSVLFKSTPEEVRMIMVDPKRVELGIYEGIPHLLTPVITDASKATNALRNAVLEMERRLKLLASQGVRNIEQFNRKMREMLDSPRRLFPEDDIPEEQLAPLPYILIMIDELADLMMLERANVEAAVTRLAQMARAVGMHLVVATQRPSVDVITGLIKANFPARISFRVATRVDSRTILDVMGAEHLLGRGDMLFLPPGSSRLMRVHGAFVTENEINRVVDFWKQQANPDYDETFLMPPPAYMDDGDEDVEVGDDPAYEDAVRVVLEMGKASTSILQRRLRLGYGRAARLLDMMQKEGIIGPPDGSRPREVLKSPDWLREVEERLQ
ncbi:MAG: DNA translocase FtsK [Bryobacteraceae bacterium]|nr:DNA translocase FtsK [Bryobacteraceae bacterium]